MHRLRPSPPPLPPPSPHGPMDPNGVASVVSSDLFEQLLLHRNDAACPAHGFYTYDVFHIMADALRQP
jgi:basic endochitinase B